MISISFFRITTLEIFSSTNAIIPNAENAARNALVKLNSDPAKKMSTMGIVIVPISRNIHIHLGGLLLLTPSKQYPYTKFSS